MSASREEMIFAQIDAMKKLSIPAEEIDRYEGDEFEDQIQTVANLQESVLDHLFGKNKVYGLNLPWFDMEDKIQFRPGELTVWNGINGHGKSLLLNQVIIGFMKQGAKCSIASLELKPEETISRMVAQTYGIRKIELTEKPVNEFFEKATGKLWLYTETGDMKPERVKAMIKYCRNELNIDHLVIDSLMKCGILEADYAAEKSFVNSLQNIAKDSGIHIHLVTHAKKQKDETASIGKFDVSGSAAITNIADNVLTVKRNKKKEEDLRINGEDKETLKKKDAFIICDKQRHGEWEGIIGLYFHESGQYTRQQGRHVPIW